MPSGKNKHRIIRNAVTCLNCGDFIESKDTHDFVMCTCGSVGVDGGHEYLRRVGYHVNYQDCSEIETIPLTADAGAGGEAGIPPS